MLRVPLLIVAGLLPALAPHVAAAADAMSPTYRLTSNLIAGDSAKASVSLEVGGELIVADNEGKEKRLPMSVVAKLAYQEQLVAWSLDSATPARSLRRYSDATATLKTEEIGATRELPKDCRLIVAEVAPEGTVFNGLDQTLTRDELDLINVVGDTLVLERLLPNRELKESEGWDHDAATIGALLGMDHVAICEVRSVVTGMENRHVQIRLAGTVHGTVDGAASEMDLRGAYLFNLDQGRVTKFNMAIKETRKAGGVTPGLDAVAKLSLVVTPLAKSGQETAFDKKLINAVGEMSREDLRQVRVESPERGYRFRHDAGWFVTSQQREVISLRLLAAGDLLAHCNVTTLPVRPADKPMTLQQFEENVVKSIGKNLGKVEAATEWANDAGHQCLGVIATGTIDEVPMQWRYYFISAEGMRPATISVTVEQSAAERFADADRPIIDSLVLLEAPAKTAAAPGAAKK